MLGRGEISVVIQVGDAVDPDLVKTKKVTDDWNGPLSNKNNGKPCLSEVDNPGTFSSFSFWTAFDICGYKSLSTK